MEEPQDLTQLVSYVVITIKYYSSNKLVLALQDPSKPLKNILEDCLDLLAQKEITCCLVVPLFQSLLIWPTGVIWLSDIGRSSDAIVIYDANTAVYGKQLSIFKSQQQNSASALDPKQLLTYAEKRTWAFPKHKIIVMSGNLSNQGVSMKVTLDAHPGQVGASCSGQESDPEIVILSGSSPGDIGKDAKLEGMSLFMMSDTAGSYTLHNSQHGMIQLLHVQFQFVISKSTIVRVHRPPGAIFNRFLGEHVCNVLSQEKFNEQYTFSEKAGNGKFGVADVYVWDGIKVLIKSPFKDGTNQSVAVEASVHAYVQYLLNNDPALKFMIHVPQLMKILMVDNSPKIVMEYVPRSQKIESLKGCGHAYKNWLYLIYSWARTLHSLELCGVEHLDSHPGNYLIVDKDAADPDIGMVDTALEFEVVLIDFGLGCIFDVTSVDPAHVPDPLSVNCMNIYSGHFMPICPNDRYNWWKHSQISYDTLKQVLNNLPQKCTDEVGYLREMVYDIPGFLNHFDNAYVMYHTLALYLVETKIVELVDTNEVETMKKWYPLHTSPRDEAQKLGFLHYAWVYQHVLASNGDLGSAFLRPSKIIVSREDWNIILFFDTDGSYQPTQPEWLSSALPKVKELEEKMQRLHLTAGIVDPLNTAITLSSSNVVETIQIMCLPNIACIDVARYSPFLPVVSKAVATGNLAKINTWMTSS